MASFAGPIFSGVETLVADVHNVTSAEIDLAKLNALIEEEFRTEADSSSQHMEHNKKKYKSWKGDIFNICVTITMWTFGITFLILLSLALFPDRTIGTISDISECLRWSNEKPEYDYAALDWYFYVLQLLRWSSTSVKMEKKFVFTDQVYEDSCVINNPLFKELRLRCTICKDVTGFSHEFKEQKAFDQPLLKKNDEARLGVGGLQQMINNNKLMLNQHTVMIKSNRTYIQTVEDLNNNTLLRVLDNDLLAHIEGRSVSYMGSHILRKAVPKPQTYVPGVVQSSTIFFHIDGENSGAYDVQTPGFIGSLMYFQASGSRRLVFTAPEHCYLNCKSFSRIMRAGDVVMYSDFWKTRSEPISILNKKSVKSVVFLELLE